MMTMTETFAVPHNREAEEAVLGSVLINPDCFREVAGVLNPGGKDFYIHRNRFVWQAFEALDAAALPVDFITVENQLAQAGRLEEIGGPAYLAAIFDQAPTSLHAEGYARIMVELSTRRDLLTLANKQANLAYDTTKPVADIIAELDHDIASITTFSGVRSSAVVTAADAVTAAVRSSEQAAAGNGIDIPTGLVDLDKKLNGGLYPEDLIIIAARSGEGKTALMGTMAANIAGLRRADIGGTTPVNLRARKTAFFSLEMPTTQVVNRILGQLTGISAGRLRNGALKDDEWPAYFWAIEQVSRSPLFFDDTPALTMHSLRQKLRKLVDQGVEVVFLDQLNFLDAQMDPKTPENIRLNWLSHRLKDMAREFKIALVVAHQMNRGVENRGKNEDPTLADLDQAGDKPASVVIFIRHEKTGEIFQNSWLFLAKNRDGAAGVRVPVVYLAERTRFENAVRLV